MIGGDFHCHTAFVDGQQTPEAMVRAAMARGLRELGVSEHAYTPLDPACSLSPADALAYREEMTRLKSKYAGQIRLLCGVEMDYDSADDPAAYDYVIGSVHYLTVAGQTYSVDAAPEETRRCIQTAFGGDRYAYAAAYFEKVAGVVDKTGAQIVGHFDLITKFAQKGIAFDPAHPVYRQAALAALDAMAGTGAVLEINTGALSRGWRSEPYPAPVWLEAWRKRGGGIVINSDAHRGDHLQFAFDRAQRLARDAGFETAGFTDRAGRVHTQY